MSTFPSLRVLSRVDGRVVVEIQPQAHYRYFAWLSEAEFTPAWQESTLAAIRKRQTGLDPVHEDETPNEEGYTSDVYEEDEDEIDDEDADLETLFVTALAQLADQVRELDEGWKVVPTRRRRAQPEAMLSDLDEHAVAVDMTAYMLAQHAAHVEDD